LTEIKGFLEKLLYAIKAFKLIKLCINLTLFNFEYIFKVFKTVKEFNLMNYIIGLMVNLRWQKLQKYYELSDDSYTYVIALIFNP
jgi:hypothetical protein